VLAGSPYDFKASHAGDKVNLQWKGAAYNANDEYEIERSTNGRDFIAVKKIASEISGNYLETDNINQVKSGELYYLVK
jgi:hypothetical protein